MKTSGHVNHPETSLGSPESVGPREKVPQALCADQIVLGHAADASARCYLLHYLQGSQCVRMTWMLSCSRLTA